MATGHLTMAAIPVITILGTRLGIAIPSGTRHGMAPIILATADMAGGGTALGAGVGAPTAIPTMLGIVATTKVL